MVTAISEDVFFVVMLTTIPFYYCRHNFSPIWPKIRPAIKKSNETCQLVIENVVYPNSVYSFVYVGFAAISKEWKASNRMVESVEFAYTHRVLLTHK